MKKLLVLLAALTLGFTCGVMACDGDDDGPGPSVEEVCCACVRDNACGGPDFSFGQCVPDGYYGKVALGIDATCVSDHCAKDCAGAQFK